MQECERLKQLLVQNMQPNRTGETEERKEVEQVREENIELA